MPGFVPPFQISFIPIGTHQEKTPKFFPQKEEGGLFQGSRTRKTQFGDLTEQGKKGDGSFQSPLFKPRRSESPTSSQSYGRQTPNPAINQVINQSIIYNQQYNALITNAKVKSQRSRITISMACSLET